jgi:Oxidoreductase molybdopterin binding domain
VPAHSTLPGRQRPRWWPRFTSTVRSTALTARLGRALGIAFGICFLTGLASYLHYTPLPLPAVPAWGYRLTQGIHVATGMASIPLLLLKLWSVYPTLFRWPPIRSVKRAAELVSLAVLVAAATVQVVTGFFNVLNWYPFGWYFLAVHYYLAYVVIGSLLLHVGLKLPDIRYGLQTKVAEGDVLTEVPWYENPASHSNAGPLPPPVTPGITRRGVLTSAGIGVGVIVATTVGQALTPLEPVGLLAVRRPSRGPQGVPIRMTAEEAQVAAAAQAPDWTLEVAGPISYTVTLADLELLADREARLPIACVEGWSASAIGRGMSLLDLVRRAGGGEGSVVRLQSLQPVGDFNRSRILGPQLAAALLATHLNGVRLDLDHGYPLRLIAPNRAGVHNTKWLARIEVA